MRILKIKVFAVCFLLAGFVAAGAMLIWQETTPETNSAMQSGSAVYQYQDPFSFKNLEAAKPAEIQAGPLPSHVGFMLWMLGMPLATLAGLAIGLTLRSRHTFASIRSGRPAQYRFVNRTEVETVGSAVPKKLSCATESDSSGFRTALRTRTVRDCQRRFRPETFNVRRENQPR